MAVEEWAAALREARKVLQLSQRALATAAGVSSQTIKAYELGLRRPSRALLSSILDALKLERGARNRILTAAGFAPDGLSLRPQPYELMFTLEEAAAEVERYPWPAFVANELMEVLAANRVAQRLWGVDLLAEFPTPVERNLLNLASKARFAERLANWDEAVKVMIAVLKGHHRGAETLEQPSLYFEAVLREFSKGDKRFVGRFLSSWDNTPPAPPKMRWSYPVVWDAPAGRMRFHCFVSAANEVDGLSFNDWIPLDGETWRRLALLADRR